jgi:hypothetical protein
MPILVKRAERKAVLARDINQLVDAFGAEHEAGDASNVHVPLLTLGLPSDVGVGDHGLQVPAAASGTPTVKKLLFDAAAGRWGQDLGGGFNYFLVEGEGGGGSGGGLLSGNAISGNLYVSGNILMSGGVYIGDVLTHINRDGLGNMTFTDVVAGTIKLSQIAGDRTVRLNPQYPCSVTYDPSNTLQQVGSAVVYGHDATAHMNFCQLTVPGTAGDVRTMIQVRLPTPFNGWGNLKLFIECDPASQPAESSVTVNLYGTDGSQATLTGASSLASSTWTQYTVGIAAGTFVAGGIVTVELRMLAGNGKWTRTGEVTLQYA